MQGLKANTFATAMSALGQKPTFAVQIGMSALHANATEKADIEADASPGTTRAPAVPVGEVVRTAYVILRPNTRDYSGLRVENFVCSSASSATATFDGLC